MACLFRTAVPELLLTSAQVAWISYFSNRPEGSNSYSLLTSSGFASLSFPSFFFDNSSDPMQGSAHKDAVSLFERYSKGGDYAKLKDWAGTTLPHIQHHLEMASLRQEPEVSVGDDERFIIERIFEQPIVVIAEPTARIYDVMSRRRPSFVHQRQRAR